MALCHPTHSTPGGAPLPGCLPWSASCPPAVNGTLCCGWPTFVIVAPHHGCSHTPTPSALPVPLHPLRSLASHTPRARAPRTRTPLPQCITSGGTEPTGAGCGRCWPTSGGTTVSCRAGCRRWALGLVIGAGCRCWALELGIGAGRRDWGPGGRGWGRGCSGDMLRLGAGLIWLDDTTE